MNWAQGIFQSIAALIDRDIEFHLCSCLCGVDCRLGNSLKIHIPSRPPHPWHPEDEK